MLKDIIVLALLFASIAGLCICFYKIGRAVQWEEDHEERK